MSVEDSDTYTSRPGEHTVSGQRERMEATWKKTEPKPQTVTCCGLHDRGTERSGYGGQQPHRGNRVESKESNKERTRFDVLEAVTC